LEDGLMTDKQLMGRLAAALLLGLAVSQAEAQVVEIPEAPGRVEPAVERIVFRDVPSSDDYPGCQVAPTEALVQSRCVFYRPEAFAGLETDDVFFIQLFPDASFAVTVTGTETVDDAVVVSGRIGAGRYGNATLVLGDEGLLGTIQVDERMFELAPAGTRVLVITEANQAKFPVDRVWPTSYDPASRGRWPDRKPRQPQMVLMSGNAAPPVISVLLLVPTPLAPECKPPYSLWHKVLATKQLNTVWAGYAKAEVEVACVTRTPVWTDADLFWLQDSQDVAELRNDFKADIVAMIVKEDYHWCGASSPSPEPPVLVPDKAFALVRRDCLYQHYTLAHEIGHLVGLRHDRIAEGMGANDLLFCDYGYYLSQNFDRTVMAVRRLCDTQGLETCARFPFHSTPDHDELPDNVHMAPDVVTGVACGQKGAARNYFWFSIAAPIVSTYR
jgi:hypothetical protein